VNIEEKLEENALSLNAKAQKSSQLSEEEKKELRRKQQEKALKFQAEIDKEIKSSFNRTKSASKQSEHDEEGEESELSENEEKSNQKATFMQQFEKDLQDLDIQENNFNEMEYSESKEELREMFAEYEKNIDRENNQMIEEKLKTRVQVIKSERKSVKFAENVEDKENFGTIRNEYGYDQREQEEDEESDYDEDSEDSDDYEEELDELTIRTPHTIRIKHTKSFELDEKENNLKLSREKPSINTPADIYSCFYKPKSILKATSSSEMNIQQIEEGVENLTGKMEPKNAEDEKFEPLKVSFHITYPILKN
jgi:hypothetical protein